MPDRKHISRGFFALSLIIAGAAITCAIVLLVTESVEAAATAGAADAVVKLLLYVIIVRFRNTPFSEPITADSFVLWFTGLSGSGKSTIADRVHAHLVKKGYRVTRLDGDIVRSIFPDTGFTREERNSHIRRVGYLASILEQNGVIVISSFVSPYAESRDFVRGLCKHFIEVFVSTSLEECERRDVKGLYRRARAGEIKQFTGIDDPYEPPQHPAIIIDTERRSIDESSGLVLSYIRKYL